jgi:protocatechuate 3,4-dioxygenase beta subunit
MRLRNGAVCFLLLTLTAAAQGPNGTISGTVTDPDGAAVANAQVQATNAAGAQFQAKAAASGSYSIAQLPAGT